MNDFTTDFSGTNEIDNPSTNGEQWDFFGNPGDFKTTKAFSEHEWRYRRYSLFPRDQQRQVACPTPRQWAVSQ